LERNGTEVYENALTNFVQLILGQGRRVILVPQYHQSRAGADRPGRRGVAEIDRVFGQAVAEHNAVTRRVSSSFNLPYLSAIETRPPFVRSDLNDSMHFNRWGAEKMADLVYRFLVDETDALAGQATCHGG